MPASATYSFTRPNDTTAYASGDLVANSTTAGSVVPLLFTTTKLVGQGLIHSARVAKSGPTATNATFNLHLFAATAPTPTNGDNGAFAIDTALQHMGTIACDMATGGVAGTAYLSKLFVPTGGIMFDLTGVPSRKIYGFLAAAAAYTPIANEVFSVTLNFTNGF